MSYTVANVPRLLEYLTIKTLEAVVGATHADHA